MSVENYCNAKYRSIAYRTWTVGEARRRFEQPPPKAPEEDEGSNITECVGAESKNEEPTKAETVPTFDDKTVQNAGLETKRSVGKRRNASYKDLTRLSVNQKRRNRSVGFDCTEKASIMHRKAKCDAANAHISSESAKVKRVMDCYLSTEYVRFATQNPYDNVSLEKSLQHTSRNGAVLPKSPNILHHSLNDLNNIRLKSSFIQLPHSKQQETSTYRQGSLKNLNMSVDNYSGIALNNKSDNKVVQQHQQYCKPSTSRGFCLPFANSKNATHYDEMFNENKPTDCCQHGRRTGHVVHKNNAGLLNYWQGHQHHCSKFINNKCLQYSSKQQQTCCYCCSYCCATTAINPRFDESDFGRSLPFGGFSASTAAVVQSKRHQTKGECQREEELLSQSVTSAVTITGGIPGYEKGFKQHGKKTRLVDETVSYAHGRTKSLDNVAKFGVVSSPQQGVRRFANNVNHLKAAVNGNSKTSTLQSAKNLLRRLYSNPLTQKLRSNAGDRSTNSSTTMLNQSSSVYFSPQPTESNGCFNGNEKFRSATSPFFEMRVPQPEELPYLPYNVHYQMEDDQVNGDSAPSTSRTMTDGIPTAPLYFTPQSIPPPPSQSDPPRMCTSMTNYVSQDEGVYSSSSTASTSSSSSSSPSSGAVTIQHSASEATINTEERMLLDQLANSGVGEMFIGKNPDSSAVSSLLFRENMNLLRSKNTESESKQIVYGEMELPKNLNWNDLFQQLKTEITKIHENDHHLWNNLKTIEAQLDLVKQMPPPQ